MTKYIFSIKFFYMFLPLMVKLYRQRRRNFVKF